MIDIKRPDLPSAAAVFSPAQLNGLAWIDVPPESVEGRGWSETEKPFDRIPTKVKDMLPGIFGLGMSSTGEYFEFTSDTSAVSVRTGLEHDQYGESNFNSAGFAGCDLYVFDEGRGAWRWAAAAQHFVRWSASTEYSLVWNLPAGVRRFRMYLPLRNRLTSLQLGTDEGAETKILPRSAEKSIAYYGTSIIHGAYCTRAGLCLTSRLGRAVGRPVINLGFSGAARFEAEMAELLAELDPAVFVCDPYHNLTAQLIRERMERFFDILCHARPDTPVLLLGAPPILNGWLYPENVAIDNEKTALFAELSAKLSKRHENYLYIPGSEFYGSDEVSVDGIHPNDEAFGNMTKCIAPVIINAMG